MTTTPRRLVNFALAVAIVMLGSAGLRAQIQRGAGQPYMLFVGNGRLILISGSMHNRASTSSSSSNGRSVTTEFRQMQGKTTLTRTLKSDEGEEMLSFDNEGTTSVTATRKPSDKSKEPSLSFSQSPGKPLEFSLGSGEAKKTWRADNLWLLLLECPKECETHLFPVLEAKEFSLDLPIEYAVLRDALTAVHVQKANAGGWDDLVAQLDDDSFAKREAADRALRAGGATAINFLKGLDLTKLTPEQQCRIARIVHGHDTVSSEDRLPAVVKKLQDNPRTWTALLADDNEPVRRRAAENLAALTGRKIDFDPAADERTRAKQIEAIRAGRD